MKKVIPIFFATDNNYAPFLSVTLKSMLSNASKKYFYKIFVLTTTLSSDNITKLNNTITKNASIEFISLKNELDKIASKFHLRDYYSKETYYRFFIANLFPQYDKVLYCDCDLIVLGDIAELYNHDMTNYLVGAVQEEVMSQISVFSDYVEKALNIPCTQYFNAGILLINTKAFRQEQIEEKFVALLNKVKFTVTQDQDYLNVLCKDKVKYFDLGWNKTAFKNSMFDDAQLKIIHFKINWKPWHYEGVEYEHHFWKFAKQTEFYEDILKLKKSYTENEKIRDKLAYAKLVEQAVCDSYNPNNYRNSMLQSIS